MAGVEPADLLRYLAEDVGLAECCVRPAPATASRRGDAVVLVPQGWVAGLARAAQQQCSAGATPQADGEAAHGAAAACESAGIPRVPPLADSADRVNLGLLLAPSQLTLPGDSPWARLAVQCIPHSAVGGLLGAQGEPPQEEQPPRAFSQALAREEQAERARQWRHVAGGMLPPGSVGARGGGLPYVGVSSGGETAREQVETVLRALGSSLTVLSLRSEEDVSATEATEEAPGITLPRGNLSAVRAAQPVHTAGSGR